MKQKFKEIEIKPGIKLEEVAVPGNILIFPPYTEVCDWEGTSDNYKDKKWGRLILSIRSNNPYTKNYVINTIHTIVNEDGVKTGAYKEYYNSEFYDGITGKFKGSLTSYLFKSDSELYKINGEERDLFEWIDLANKQLKK